MIVLQTRLPENHRRPEARARQAPIRGQHGWSGERNVPSGSLLLLGMMHNPVSGSPSHLRRAYLATRPLVAWLFSLPILGYALRIPVGVMKLPRFNAHLRRLDSEVWQLGQASVGWRRWTRAWSRSKERGGNIFQPS